MRFLFKRKYCSDCKKPKKNDGYNLCEDCRRKYRKKMKKWLSNPENRKKSNERRKMALRKKNGTKERWFKCVICGKKGRTTHKQKITCSDKCSKKLKQNLMKRWRSTPEGREYMRKKMRKYIHTEKGKKTRKRYEKEHKEEILAYNREYFKGYRKTPKYREYFKGYRKTPKYLEWYERTRKKRREYQRKWKEKNKRYNKEYYQKNKDKNSRRKVKGGNV